MRALRKDMNHTLLFFIPDMLSLGVYIGYVLLRRFTDRDYGFK